MGPPWPFLGCPRLPNDGKTQLTHATISRSKLQRAWPRDDQDVTEEQAEHRVPGGRGRASGCAGVAPSKRGTAGGGCWPGQWLLGAWGGSADLHSGSLLRKGFTWTKFHAFEPGVGMPRPAP